ncbi:TetR/AcrR family transcriptional regulator [Cupriavidus lacunae]|uniref:TetR/AcrR family transcriptional regulator n=1 Tax=Cupriavidus lacunae TaxID=2666307 RepID=A0A370P212_9BURK|nr:TetR/AcrR family transcriptional regulator [Cupriavidus lacunae]RDK11867.1 TetR/AcrR family transcriptional regulator [Cupriavidus lacunae]
MTKRQANATAVDTREKLMRLAARAFGTQGYAATTMRGIADQAGIEAASIYYHFSSKEELLDAVMEHGAQSIFAHTQARIAALPPGVDAEQRFRAGLLGLFSAMIKYGDYTLAHGRQLAELPDKVRERHLKRRAQHQTFWSGMLEDLRTEGHLRDDIDIALCRVFVLSTITSVQTWFNPKKGSPEKVIDELCAILFEGVRPKQVRKPARRAQAVAS